MEYKICNTKYSEVKVSPVGSLEPEQAQMGMRKMF